MNMKLFYCKTMGNRKLRWFIAQICNYFPGERPALHHVAGYNLSPKMRNIVSPGNLQHFSLSHIIQTKIQYKLLYVVDTIVVTLFVISLLSLTNTESEENPNNNLMMRQAGLPSMLHISYFRKPLIWSISDYILLLMILVCDPVSLRSQAPK